jgi:large subunit ribosomal protein L28
MAKVCQVTGKRPISGNNVSHAHNKNNHLIHFQILPFLLDLSNASNLLKLNHWYQLFDKLKSLNLGVVFQLDQTTTPRKGGS